MIAQILATNRATAPEAACRAAGEPTRGLDLAARMVHISLAIALLPALAAMLVVGGVGAAAYGLASLAARSAGWEGGAGSEGFTEESSGP